MFIAAARSNGRWILIACILLGLSGAVRHWRSLQFLAIENQSKESPFPLREIPYVLGTWRSLEGTEATLDPEIARIAGSSDHVIRAYVDDKTGERVTVLLLYGPSQAVWAHTPEVCYPASGFTTVIPSREIQVPLEDSARTAAFREALYGKTRGGLTELSEVYYSFFNAGVWRSDMSGQWKQFRYHPGMFKIQIERRVKTPQLGDSPAKGLLALLVREIEERSSSTARPASSTTVAAAPPGE
jgi:EpsI family protein